MCNWPTSSIAWRWTAEMLKYKQQQQHFSYDQEKTHIIRHLGENKFFPFLQKQMCIALRISC